MVPEELKRTLSWLIDVGEWDTAKKFIGSLMRYFPNCDRNFAAQEFLSTMLFFARAYPEATQHARRALSLNPSSPRNVFNLAVCLLYDGQLKESELAFRKLEKNVEINLHLALSYFLQGQMDLFESAVQQLQGDCGQKEQNLYLLKPMLGWLAVRDGDINGGISLLSNGRAIDAWGCKQSHIDDRPRLSSAEGVVNQRVLVLGEGGVGNEIFCARYAKAITARRGSVVWATDRMHSSLQDLLLTIGGISEVVFRDQVSRDTYDTWVACSDLSLFFPEKPGTDSLQPYVFPDKTSVERMRRTLSSPSGKTLNIGVSLRVGRSFHFEKCRNAPAILLESLRTVPNLGVHFLDRDADALSGKVSQLGTASWQQDLGEWDQLAAAISAMDLVITQTSAVAHLAGALGKQAWVICQPNCPYQWTGRTRISPWYPSVRLYRQTRANDWNPIYLEILSDIKDMKVPGEDMRQHPREGFLVACDS